MPNLPLELIVLLETDPHARSMAKQLVEAGKKWDSAASDLRDIEFKWSRSDRANDEMRHALDVARARLDQAGVEWRKAIEKCSINYPLIYGNCYEYELENYLNESSTSPTHHTDGN